MRSVAATCRAACRTPAPRCVRNGSSWPWSGGGAGLARREQIIDLRPLYRRIEEFIALTSSSAGLPSCSSASLRPQQGRPDGMPAANSAAFTVYAGLLSRSGPGPSAPAGPAGGPIRRECPRFAGLLTDVAARRLLGAAWAGQRHHLSDGQGGADGDTPVHARDLARPGAGTGSGITANATCRRPARSRVRRYT